jgi:flagellar hook-length control protein FliK
MEGLPVTGSISVTSTVPAAQSGKTSASAPAAGSVAGFASALAKFLTGEPATGSADGEATGDAADAETGTASPAEAEVDDAAASTSTAHPDVLTATLAVLVPGTMGGSARASEAAATGAHPTPTAVAATAAVEGAGPAVDDAGRPLPALSGNEGSAAGTGEDGVGTAPAKVAGLPVPPGGAVSVSGAPTATLSTPAGDIPLVVTPREQAAGLAPVVQADTASADVSAETTPVASVPIVRGASDTASTATAASVRELPVATQVVRQVAVLRGAPDGAYTMTVQMSPDELGPVQVKVTFEGGSVDMTLRSAHEHGRSALIQALPDLRRDLEGAGLSCNTVEVDVDGDQSSWFSSQRDAGGNHDEQHQADRRTRSGMPSGDQSDNPPVVADDQSTSPGVDVRM